VRAVMAENLLLKHQLIVLRRGRRRAPNLTRIDRMVCGFWSLFLNPRRIRAVAIAFRPSTLLAFHQALVRHKYRRLFSSSRPSARKPGPRGPDERLVRAIVDLKSRNPRFGCPRIARIISQTFGIDIDKNVVYRVLAQHHRPAPGGTGPSWLSFIGHTADSLWSVDLFRCESIVLRSYWVLVVMDQYTRRLVGMGVHHGAVTAADLCRMFNTAIHGRGTPRHLSTDHDPLFDAHRWMANLRILDVEEIKTVPYAPLSHPFVERLIGTIRRECWTAHFSGRQPIWRRSFSNFSGTTTATARMLGWTGIRQHRLRTKSGAARASIRIDGSRTVAGSTKRRSPRDACARRAGSGLQTISSPRYYAR